MKNLNEKTKPQLLKEIAKLNKRVAELEFLSTKKTGRKDENELRENEQNIQAILDASPDIIHLLDIKGIILSTNEVFAKRIGLKIDDVIGKSVFDYTPPGAVDKKKAMINTVFKMGDPIQFEDIGHNGVYESHIHPIFDNEGRVIAVAIYARDITERKLTEKALQESEILLKATQKLTKVGGWKWNIENQTMYWTHETYRIHEIDQSEIESGSAKHIEIGVKCYDEKDRQIILDAFQKCANEGISYDMEFPFTTFKGNRIWIRTIARAIKENEKVVDIIGNIMDITDHKIAMEAIHKSEMELKEAQRIGHLGSWYLNLANNEVVWTRELYEMYNFDPKLPPPLYTEHKKLFKPESWNRLNTALSKIREIGIPYELELETVRKDGSSGWMWVRGEQVKNENGVVVGLRGVAQDITMRKNAEVDLKESQTLNQTLLETSPDLIYIYDIIDDEYIYSNPGIIKILGYSIEEIQGFGKNIQESLMHPDDIKTYRKDIIRRYQTAKDGEYINNEFRVKHKDGNWTWLLSKETVFLRQDDGSPKQIFGLTSDITDRKKYNNKIKQLNRNLEQKIKERTLELEMKNKDLEKMNKFFVGRELKMAELKKQILNLNKKIQG